MRRLTPAFALAAYLLGPSVETLAGQSPITLRRPTGEIGIEFDGTWVDLQAANDLTTRRFQEWIRLQFGGAVLHPQFFNFRLGLRPVLGQTSWQSVPESPTGGITGIDFNGAAQLLSGASVSLTVRASRSTLDRREQFGRKSETLRTNFAALLRYRNPYMPVHVEYSDRFRDVTFGPTSDRLIRQEQTTRALRLLARSSKTRVHLERVWFDDRAGEREFTEDRARFAHRLRWGKRSRLRSTFQYSRRAGTVTRDGLAWAQSAHLQHTWSLSSDYDYKLSSRKTPANDCHDRSGRVSVTYRPRQPLELGAEVSGRSSFFTTGRQSLYWAKPRMSFATQLPLRGLLRVSGALAYQWQHQEPSREGLATVIDELHIVDESASFLLNEPFPDRTSVVLASADQTIVFQDGFDYVLADAPPFLEVIVLPGGRIAVGDTITAGYRFEILPEVSLQAIVADYAVSIRLSVVTLFHSRSVRRDVNGAPEAIPLLLDYDDVSTGINIGVPTPIGHLGLTAQQDVRRSDDQFDLTSYRVQGALAFGLNRHVRARLGGSGHFRRGSALPFNLVSGNADLEWSVTPRLRLQANGSAYRWEENGRREVFLGWGGGLQWQIARLALRMRYDRAVWHDGFDRRQNRLYVQLVRGF